MEADTQTHGRDDRKCSECSYAVEQHDRDFRFLLPNEFSGFSAEERQARLSGDNKFLQVDESRYFIRSILPVQLRGGHSVAYGVWLESTIETLRLAYEVWDDPSYATLTIEGTLANDLPPWPDTAIGARVQARPRRLDELPYVEQSTKEGLSAILDTEWDHDRVLRTFAE